MRRTTRATRTAVATALATALGLTTLGVTSGAPATARTSKAATVVTDGCLDSVPEPGETEPVQICYTLFRPGSATGRKAKVPLVFQSHGWGGSRWTEEARRRGS